MEINFQEQPFTVAKHDHSASQSDLMNKTFLNATQTSNGHAWLLKLELLTVTGHIAEWTSLQFKSFST